MNRVAFDFVDFVSAYLNVRFPKENLQHYNSYSNFYFKT